MTPKNTKRGCHLKYIEINSLNKSSVEKYSTSHYHRLQKIAQVAKSDHGYHKTNFG